MRVPFVDLSAAYSITREELDEAYSHVMENGNLILGEEVMKFESEFASYCGAAECVGVGSGLEALHLSLVAAGIGQGDEVIVPANTFIGTWLAVTHAGAVPVPVDADPVTYNLDATRLEEAVTGKTKAIMPVDLYGQPADAAAVSAIAERHSLLVIQDAAQSHGASYRGRKTGSYSDITCFSFYPVKNLGAAGDGGAVVTRDSSLAEKLRVLRNYGSHEKYIHDVAGFNSRLDELQAAILRTRLRHLDQWNERRNSIAERYTKNLGDSGTPRSELVLPVVAEGIRSAWHLYVVQLQDRERVRASLSSKGVETLIHYPVPPHLQAAYAHLGYGTGSFPVTESLARRVLSLPVYPQMTDEMVDYVADGLIEAVGHRISVP